MHVAHLSLCISQGQTPPRTVLVSPLPASFSHVSPCPPAAPILQSAVTVLLGPASCQGPADPSGTRRAPLWSGIAFEAAPLALPGANQEAPAPPVAFLQCWRQPEGPLLLSMTRLGSPKMIITHPSVSSTGAVLSTLPALDPFRTQRGRLTCSPPASPIALQ